MTQPNISSKEDQEITSTEQQVLDFLHRNIPITKALGVQVLAASARESVLAAPLAANVNHYDTVFGGSASTLAILAAWTVIYVRLRESGGDARLVIQKTTMDYQRSITADFTANASLSDEGKWDNFLKTLRRRGKARISADATLLCQGDRVAEFQGHFVAIQVGKE